MSSCVRSGSPGPAGVIATVLAAVPQHEPESSTKASSLHRADAMTRLRRFFLIILIVSAVGPSWQDAVGASPPVRLTILHVNDFHGHLLPFIEKAVQNEPVGGAASLEAAIAAKRTLNPEGTLLLSAGDMFQGSPVSDLFRGQPVLEMMNAFRFDAMALGNHEFDWGPDVLNRLRTGAAFPFLAANIVDAGGKYLPGVQPYALFQRKGLRIAVIGLTTTGTPYATKPDHVKGLTFVEPATVLPSIMAEARAKGAVCFIVLSHLGFDKDLELARQVPGIHIIVGGHSHTIVPDPVVAGETLIVQAGYYGIYLGALDLDVDPLTGKILDYPSKGVLQRIKPEDATNRKPAFVEQYDRMVRGEFNRIVGRASVDLVRADAGESNIGNMIGDAIKESTGADVAFMNGGGIRADIPAGDITLEQVYTMEPFDNVVVTMDLTGAQILEILEESASGRHRLMQVSGLTVRYDAARPLGARVAAAAAAGRPIVHDRTYRVAAHDFLAAGGDRYATFLHGKRVAYGETLRDVILSYLKRHAPVSPRIEGRIIVTGR